MDNSISKVDFTVTPSEFTTITPAISLIPLAYLSRNTSNSSVDWTGEGGLGSRPKSIGSITKSSTVSVLNKINVRLIIFSLVSD